MKTSASVHSASHRPGHVWLIGAGPGDPELLTLKAVRALAAADVVLVDDLVNPAILEHASATARVVHVGKRGGCESTPQAFIDRLMVSEALAGRSVARLKGGDTAIFSRAGEELAACAAAGVRCEIVPGITSASAAAAAIGLPLTHRDHGHGVAFITGHPKPGAPDVDWTALAKTGLTLVVYMGLTRAKTVQDALIAGGLAGDTPFAAIERASRVDQRVTVGRVESLADTLTANAVKSPAVLIIGSLIEEAMAALAAQESSEPLRKAA